jgi:antitoxin component YwqK of YwqJK toxin-antitoxin module
MKGLKFYGIVITLGFFINSVVANHTIIDNPINQKDTQGKKQGKWIYYGKDRPQSGYPQNAKIEEGYFKNDRKEGVWTYYYEGGITPKLIGSYVNNRPEGNYTKFYSSGKIEETGSFIRNKNIDTLRRYHPNGKIQFEAVYNQQGKENGTIKFYHANGNLEFKYKSTAGTPTGKAERYFENGDLREIVVFGTKGSVAKRELKKIIHKEKKANEITAPTKDCTPKSFVINTKGVKFQPNGYNKIYNSNDEIWQDGDFKNGQLWDGKIYEYDRDGILLKVKVYQHGTYHSDGQL